MTFIHESQYNDHLKAVLILAAGAGTRMKSQLPKIMHNVCGLSIIQRIFDALDFINEPNKIVVTLKHKNMLIKNHILAFNKKHKRINFIFQDNIPGTGRSVELVLNHMLQKRKKFHKNDCILIINGDIPLLKRNTIIKMLNFHYSKQNFATVMSGSLNNPSGYGRIIKDSNGFLMKIIEDKDISLQDVHNIKEVNSGVYIFNCQLLNESISKIPINSKSKEKYLTDVIECIYNRFNNKTQTFICEDNWQIRGVNCFKELIEISLECNKRILEDWMSQGVNIIDPRNTWIDSTVNMKRDITILPNTQLYGHSSLLENSIIGPNTLLKNSFVGKDVNITFSYIYNSKIGSRCQIGPFAHLRPGSVINADSKVGSFVETKDASIGKNSKISHLSYVGNACIGNNANIGAGSIFVNYDGMNKHNTIVGNNVRMGSNNMYIAPVKIGNNVYSGAGTIIRKDVPDYSLALTINSQKNLHNWVKNNRNCNKKQKKFRS